MAIRTEHDLHRRRMSRNVGLGLALLIFVALVYGLTVAKVGDLPVAGQPQAGAAE